MERPWRYDPQLDPFRHPDRPDDLEVRFYLWEQEQMESMWVSVCALDPAIAGYAGRLLDQLATPGGPAPGSTVSIRIAPGCPQPIWVSPAMRANLARWRSICTACGFDMLTRPAQVIAARQFPDAPEGCVPVKFTTRCPLCEQTMRVDTRV